MHHPRTLLILVALAALSAAAFAQSTATRPATRSGLGAPTLGPNGEMILKGTTEPSAKVDVPSSIRGILAEVYVKEGQAVKREDPLAKLDDSVQVQQVELARLEAEQTSEIENAENNIRFAQEELRRLQGRGSEIEIRQKQLALTTAELGLKIHRDKQKQNQVRLAQEQITLKRMTMRSPVEGFVLNVHKQVGEMTDEGPVITVVQTNKLNAVFFLQGSLFGKVAVGDKVPLDFEGGLKREGVVAAVDPVIASGLFRVKLEVDNSDAKIPAGLGAVWTWTTK